MHIGWDETQQGEITQNDQRDITDHMTSCSVYQLGRRRKGRTFKVMVFVSPGES